MIPLRKVRDNIRIRLKDTDSRNPTYTGPEYDMAIAAAYIATHARLPQIKAYMTSDLTLTAGASTAALASTVTQWTGGSGGREYAGHVEIRLQSTGDQLVQIPWEMMRAYRSGYITLPTARPSQFALLESKTQAVTAYFDVLSDSSYVCDVYATLAADDLLDYVGSGTDDADDVSLQMSRQAALAVELVASSELVARMVDEELRERRLNPNAVTLWKEEAERMVYLENNRQNQLDDLGMTQRVVS